MKPTKQVIDELNAEYDEVFGKYIKINNFLSDHADFPVDHTSLLLIQALSYRAAAEAIASRLSLLHLKEIKELATPTKYNIKVPHLKNRFYFRWSDGSLISSDKLNNGMGNQQWTMEQIKEYGLEDCERIEIDA